MKKGSFNYFDNIKKLVQHSENDNSINYYIIAVNTPSDMNGNCDTSIVENVIKDINLNSTKETIIIIKSTVVPCTCDKLQLLFPKNNIILLFITHPFLYTIKSAEILIFLIKFISFL